MKQLVVEKGFSLIEVIITIVVIGIALLAAVGGWSNITRSSADVMWQTKVSYLGQAYLEEILSKRFDENTPFAGGSCTITSLGCSPVASFGVTTSSPPYTSNDGEARVDFDDVDDFDGIDEEAVGLFVGITGNATPQAYVGYRIAVNVQYVGATYLSGANELLKEIQVTVTPPPNTGQAPVTFSALKGNY